MLQAPQVHACKIQSNINLVAFLYMTIREKRAAIESDIERIDEKLKSYAEVTRGQQTVHWIRLEI